MTTTHAISALTKKYAELSGQLLTADKAMEEVNGLDNYDEALAQLDRKKASLRASLNHIHQVALLFDPAWSPSNVKAKKPRQAPVLDENVASLALRVLREANQPLTIREIVHGVKALAGRDDAPESVAAKIDANVSNTMTRYEAWGYVKCEPGSPRRWSLVPRSERRP